jgi:hypothetical protein
MEASMSKDKMDSPSSEENIQDANQTENSSASDEQDFDNSTEDSSASGESEPELSTLDLVKEAIKPEKEGDDETEGSSEEDESDEEDESKDKSESEDDDSDEPSEEELKHWKPKTRKRFEQLQAKYRDVNQRLEKAEADAGWKQQFDTFLETNQMSMEEANKLFEIGALMKSNHMKALEMITPYYNQLLEVTGNVLPRDLQEQVNQGYITEAAAIEMSRGRAQNQHYQVRNQQQQQQRQQQEAENQKKLSTDIQVALANLENSWQTSDPDYKTKSNRIQERVKLMWYEASRTGKMPRSVDEAIKMVEGAKSEIDKEYRQFRPRKPVSVVDSGGNSGQTKPEPKTTLDVIRQTVGA